MSVLAAIDAWEHAYMIDYGTKKPDYIAKILDSINWKVINERFSKIHPR
jgi:Fe-Mn family superoxide dismutase